MYIYMYICINTRVYPSIPCSEQRRTDIKAIRMGFPFGSFGNLVSEWDSHSDHSDPNGIPIQIRSI